MNDFNANTILGLPALLLLSGRVPTLARVEDLQETHPALPPPRLE
jgi:hypothetical protein